MSFKGGRLPSGTVIIIGIIFLALSFSLVSADEPVGKGYYYYGFKEFGVYSGFQRGSLKEKDDYELVPAMLHFGFDLRPFFKNKSEFVFEFLMEPFLNTVISPDYNIEIGNNFMLKFALPLNKRLYPYVEGGLGLAYLTQHTREQSTQFNFTNQAGLGITYLLRRNLALSLGYRFRHLSNASVARPNGGIDTDSVILGLSLLY